MDRVFQDDPAFLHFMDILSSSNSTSYSLYYLFYSINMM